MHAHLPSAAMLPNCGMPAKLAMVEAFASVSLSARVVRRFAEGRVRQTDVPLHGGTSDCFTSDCARLTACLETTSSCQLLA